MHYSYIISRTNDENKKLMLEIRLEVAKSELESINTDLESYILKH